MMLPNGWKKVKLGDLVSVASGRNKVRNDMGKYPVYGSTGIIGLCDDFQYSGDSILIARVGANAGFIHRANGQYDVSDNTLVVECGKEYDFAFAYQQLRGINLNQYVFGSGQPLVTGGLLKKIELSLPPLEEQKKIAATLSVWDSAIEKMEKLIEAKGKSYACFLTTSIMSDTYAELGIFLTEVSERNKDEKIQQVLSVSNSKGFVLPEEQFDRKVASENLSNYKIVRLGQYAYNPSRINVGSIARLNDWKEAVISPMYTVFEIENQKQLDSDFLLHWLNSSEAKQRIKNSAQGSVRETVGFGDLCKIKIPKFDLKKQQKIVSVLNSMNQEVTLLMQQLENYKKQKQGLMQKLLTGQWRVK